MYHSYFYFSLFRKWNVTINARPGRFEAASASGTAQHTE